MQFRLILILDCAIANIEEACAALPFYWIYCIYWCIPVKKKKLIPGSMALAVLQAWSPTGAKFQWRAYVVAAGCTTKR